MCSCDICNMNEIPLKKYVFGANVLITPIERTFRNIIPDNIQLSHRSFEKSINYWSIDYVFLRFL